MALDTAIKKSSRATRDVASNKRLAGLAALGGTDIETPILATVGGALHSLFDPVLDDSLPIYFGPLLGRLYLEGL